MVAAMANSTSRASHLDKKSLTYHTTRRWVLDKPHAVTDPPGQYFPFCVFRLFLHDFRNVENPDLTPCRLYDCGRRINVPIRPSLDKQQARNLL